MNESDGIDEALGRSLRGMMQLAEQNGRQWSEVLRRMREIARLRQEEAARRAEARARYQAAWEKAQEKLAVVDDPEWWDQATPEQIAEVYEVAVSWREHEVEAARVDDVIYDEVLERYDHDLRTPSAEQVREDLEKIEAQRKEQEQESDAERGEEGSLVPEPEAKEEAKAEAAETNPPTWDSEERRTLVEQQMRDEGVAPELVETRMRVDRMNATHPRDAIQGKHAATRLRGPRGRSRTRQAESAMGR
ncbi:hypothetical protein KIK06_17585 [Nocardiopsis sp. EMB25]|uniref:hypothetical protein n=1 Tax=Nocardiopsis sp. EMB25 TaxID=2835867 RepID=UPI0022849B9F|nr:hypothetical protein [Nocardiopsis sp. EMB25]MCY9785701.1 hypothetical protein [Nocardiopsis sp. EMB25]